MKKENYIYISDQENYPSLETLSRYVRGDLPEAEKIRIDKMIENDPFLADVLEGLNGAKDVAQVKSAVGRIKAHSQKRLFTRTKKRENLTKRQSRVSPHKYTQLIMATAAAITLLFVTVFIVEKIEFKDPNKPQIAENLEIEQNANLNNDHSADPDPDIIPPVDSLKRETESETNQPNKSLFSENKPVNEKKETDQVLRKNIATGGGNDHSGVKKPENIIQRDAPKPVTATTGTVVDDLKQDSMLEEADESVTESSLDDELITARETGRSSQAELTPQKAEADKKEAAKQRELLDKAKVQKEKAEYMSEKEVNNIPLRQQGPVLIPLDSRLEAKTKKSKYKDKADYLKPEDAPLLTDEQIMMGKYQKNLAMTDLMIEAVRLYKEGSYQASLSNVFEVLRADPDNVVAKYYAGGCYFAMQEYKIATSYLRDVVKEPDTEFEDDARWLLAQAYMERNRFRNAESELKTLVEENSKYADQAAELIEKINR